MLHIIAWMLLDVPFTIVKTTLAFLAETILLIVKGLTFLESSAMELIDMEKANLIKAYYNKGAKYLAQAMQFKSSRKETEA